MVQVLEAVSPAIPLNELECPFNHDLPEPPDVKNDLKGKGSTLGDRMCAPQGTHMYEAIKATYAPDAHEKELDPRDVGGHVLSHGNKPVTIQTASGTTHRYPVTCAAHHCIPAQESLKGHQILAFMCKKGTSDGYNHGYSGGRVWSNVGYDVNGCQNGVYLPGSYAVGGGRGGMGVWVKDMPDKENEDVSEPEAPESNLLTGHLPGDTGTDAISNSNRKWLYVKQAMKLAHGQFHDRHVDYSQKFVQGGLKKLFEHYVNKFNGSFRGDDCSQCKNRKDKYKEFGIPTPYGLVERLNSTSRRYRGFLEGDKWPHNVYTSNWGRACMEAKLSLKPDAD
jgi:hypothetical protein